MIHLFDGIRDVTLLSVTIRMLFAVLCGGLIGLEREFRRRPAGLRTHILICLGSAITTLTSQYLFLDMHYFTDMGRLGAQVIAGMGFIGAGTIIITRRNRIKGLTTAAGLWATAIIGLAVGAGFYEGAILTTLIILLSQLVFAKVEYMALKQLPDITLYVEFERRRTLEQVLQMLRKDGVKIVNLEIARASSSDKISSNAVFTLQFKKRSNQGEILQELASIDGVYTVEEL